MAYYLKRRKSSNNQYEKTSEKRKSLYSDESEHLMESQDSEEDSPSNDDVFVDYGINGENIQDSVVEEYTYLQDSTDNLHRNIDGHVDEDQSEPTSNLLSIDNGNQRVLTNSQTPILDSENVDRDTRNPPDGSGNKSDRCSKFKKIIQVFSIMAVVFVVGMVSYNVGLKRADNIYKDKMSSSYSGRKASKLKLVDTGDVSMDNGLDLRIYGASDICTKQYCKTCRTQVYEKYPGHENHDKSFVCGNKHLNAFKKVDNHTVACSKKNYTYTALKAMTGRIHCDHGLNVNMAHSEDKCCVLAKAKSLLESYCDGGQINCEKGASSGYEPKCRFCPLHQPLCVDDRKRINIRCNCYKKYRQFCENITSCDGMVFDTEKYCKMSIKDYNCFCFNKVENNIAKDCTDIQFGEEENEEKDKSDNSITVTEDENSHSSVMAGQKSSTSKASSSSWTILPLLYVSMIFWHDKVPNYTDFPPSVH